MKNMSEYQNLWDIVDDLTIPDDFKTQILSPEDSQQVPSTPDSISDLYNMPPQQETNPLLDSRSLRNVTSNLPDQIFDDEEQQPSSPADQQHFHQMAPANETVQQQFHQMTPANETVQQQFHQIAPANETVQQQFHQIAPANETVQQQFHQIASANETVQQQFQTQPMTTQPTNVVHEEELNVLDDEQFGMQQHGERLPVGNFHQQLKIIDTGDQQILFAPVGLQQTVPISASQPTMATPVTQKGGGVVDVPALTDMEGMYNFKVTIKEKEHTTKSPMWLMSKVTKKLYTNINKSVPFEIHLKRGVPSEHFRIRATAVFSSAQFLRTNVSRCPNHASSSDSTNHGFPYPSHVVRADHPEAQYETSPNGRLSVVVPLDILQDGSNYTPILLRFMCLGSCVGGINRRPIAIILTLENIEGRVYGRKVVDVRVCACPTRDIRTDEQTLLNKGVKRRGSTLQEKPLVPLRKKPKNVEPKIEPVEDDRVFHLEVHGKKLYDFLQKMKQVYYDTHPEYAMKYPDESLQNEDDSEDEMKSNSLPSMTIGDPDSISFDSGGNYQQHHVVYSSDSQVDISTAPKNSSPLSKLTPNISVSKLRLFPDEEVDSEMINISQELIIANSMNGKANEIIIGSSQPSNSMIPLSKSSVMQSLQVTNSDCLPSHVPVRQVQSYRPGSVTLKAKPLSALKYNLHNSNGEEKRKRTSVKKSSLGSVDHERIFSGSEVSYELNTSEEYYSPASPEMLAANVLAEGFKSKSIIKQ